MNQDTEVRKRNHLTGHNASVYALALIGSDIILSGGGDKIVASWDLNNPGEGTLLAAVPEVIYSLYADESKDRVLIGQAAGGLHVISLREKKEIRLLQYHGAPIFHIAISKRHNVLFSLTGDGKLGVIDNDSLELKALLTVSEGKLRACALNEDETMLVVGGADGTITIFSLPGMIPVKHWQAHEKGFSVNAIAFTPGDKQLLTGSRDAHLNIFDVENDFRLLKSIPAHNYAIYSIVFSPDKKYFATCSRDKTIKIWDANDMDILYRIDLEKNEGHKNSVNKIVWNNKTGQLISAGDDRNIMIWDIITP